MTACRNLKRMRIKNHHHPLRSVLEICTSTMIAKKPEMKIDDDKQVEFIIVLRDEGKPEIFNPAVIVTTCSIDDSMKKSHYGLSVLCTICSRSSSLVEQSSQLLMSESTNFAGVYE